MKSIVGNIVTSDGVKFGIITYSRSIISVEYLSVDPDTIMYPALSVYIFPGFIDLSVKCSETSSGRFKHREDYETASLAALNGGVVYLFDIQDEESIVDNSSYCYQQTLAEKSLIDISQCCTINAQTEPFDNIQYIANFNVLGKIDYESVVRRYSGLQVAFYCGNENQKVELRNVQNIIELANKYKIKARVAISTVEELKVISQAKKAGVEVKAEVGIHNLFFDTSMINFDNKPFLTYDYSIRNRNNRRGLLEALRIGRDIDYITSQHSPCTIEEKLAGRLNCPHLDFFGSFLCYLISNYNISVSEVLKVVCHNQSDLIKELYGKKIGRIEIGYDASFTILDLRSFMTRSIQSKAGWLPFDIHHLDWPGSSIEVYVRGDRVVYDQMVGRPI